MPRLDLSDALAYPSYMAHSLIMPHMHSAEDILDRVDIFPPTKPSSPLYLADADDLVLQDTDFTRPDHTGDLNSDPDQILADKPSQRQETKATTPERGDETDYSDCDSDTQNRPRSKRRTKTLTPGSLMARQTLPASKSANASPRVAGTQRQTSPASKSDKASTRKRRSDTLPLEGSSPYSDHSSVKAQARVSNEVRKMPDTEDEDDIEVDEAVEDNAGTLKRSLRKRTVRQTNPFKFDKHEYNAQKSGQASSRKKVEKEVEREIEGSQKQPPKKKVRTTSSKPAKKTPTAQDQKIVKPARSTSVLSVNSSLKSDQKTAVDLARVTLRVRLAGFDGAATRLTVDKCSDIEGLLAFIIVSWYWKFNGKEFSHAIASFPWLSDDSNILLRTDFEDSFLGMMTEIENAPAWTEADDARCEIDITAYLE